jgi:hypothetical protein
LVVEPVATTIQITLPDFLYLSALIPLVVVGQTVTIAGSDDTNNFPWLLLVQYAYLLE